MTSEIAKTPFYYFFTLCQVITSYHIFISEPGKIVCVSFNSSHSFFTTLSCEAEDYRYYWQSSWESNPPSWLKGENAEWPGNYKVRFRESEWQAIIYGNDNSYLKKIFDAGFDGVYLDIIDAFEYF